jgi:hypothetical protein
VSDKKTKSEEQKPGTTITGCVLTGVRWDATAIEPLRLLAQALASQAKATETLAAVFRSQNVTVGPLLNIH